MPFYTWLDPQSTSYGFGYGSLQSLVGHVYRLADVIRFCLVFGRWIDDLRSGTRHHHPKIRREGRLRHQVLAQGVAKHLNQIYILNHAWVWEGPRSPPFYLQLWLCPSGSYPS